MIFRQGDTSLSRTARPWTEICKPTAHKDADRRGPWQQPTLTLTPPRPPGIPSPSRTRNFRAGACVFWEHIDNRQLYDGTGLNSKPGKVPPPSHALSLRDPLPDGRGISVPSCAFGLPEVPVPALVKRKPGNRDGDASTASYALDDKRLCVALSGPVFDDELHWDRGFFRFSNCPNL
jgi:hypothetical protein